MKKKVLLISMPFGALERPALGISILKARLAQEGIGCDIRYFTFSFAEFIGLEEYHWLANDLPYTAFAGDWTFTRTLFGPSPELDRGYLKEILLNTWKLTLSDVSRVLKVRSNTPKFLDRCLESVKWADYAVVGFTSTFEQNIASLALAKRIKGKYPEIKIVFGGANWEAGMGLELHSQFEFVDYVCSGEAEESFPALVRGILDRKPTISETIKGIVFRSLEGSKYTGSPDLIRDLDRLPYPDYGDYFRDLEQSTVSAPIVPTLLFETSRGCWWGAKSHCTFCGLNGGSMAFRSKGSKRALDELTYLIGKWKMEMVEAVDNILDMKYFQSMLPDLIRANLGIQLFYEVKANLSRAQVKLLSEAGVCRVQPGIESLSDHILTLMRKGTTALRNIQMLKWAKEYNIEVDWNILYGFPGEQQEDYEAMLKLLPSIRFLNPPCAVGPIRLDRFSPYQMNPADFGLANMRPLSTYRYLYPFGADSLERLAYYFDFDYQPNFEPCPLAGEVIAYVEEWRKNPEKGTLVSVEDRDGNLVLFDTRSNAETKVLTLADEAKVAYEYCDETRAIQAIVQRLQQLHPARDVTQDHVRSLLETLVETKMMISDGENYLSLALKSHSPKARLGNPSSEVLYEVAAS